MTPPASTEPIFGILMSELEEWEKENLCWSEVQDLQQRIRARGPVQQVPAANVDMSDLELVNGRLEGLHLLLDTPANEKTMTDAELKFAIMEIEVIRDCIEITASGEPEQEGKD